MSSRGRGGPDRGSHRGSDRGGSRGAPRGGGQGYGRGGGMGDSGRGHERGGGDTGRGGYDRGRGGGGYQGRGGGGGYRGRGGGGDHEVLKRNVRDPNIHEKPVIKSLKIKKHLVKKPAKPGSEGRPLELIANHYRLVLQDITFYHYDIDIKLGSDSGRTFHEISGPKERKMRKMSHKENVELMQKLAKEWIEVFGKIDFVFDGLRNLYTKQKLRLIGSEQMKRNVKITFDGFREQTYEVGIQTANEHEIQMSLINDFYGGALDYVPQDCFQALEIILRYIPAQTRIPVGRSLFIRENQTGIGENANMAYGHFQSVNLTEVGPTVVVDRVATLFRTPGPLITFMSNEIRLDLKRNPLDNDMIDRLNKSMSGLKIYAEHIGGKRYHVIDSLTFKKPKDCEFEIDGEKEKEKVKTNVKTYFKKQYNIDLKYDYLPVILLKGGHNRYLPVELCNVRPDQPIPRSKITPNMTKEIVSRSGQQKPINRFGVIQESAEVIESESRDLLKAMGIQLITKPVKVNARVLNVPQMDGSEKRVADGKELNDWFFLNLSPIVEHEMGGNGRVRSFVEELIEEGMHMNIRIRFPEGSRVRHITDNSQKSIESCFVNVKKMCPSVQMIIFCIPVLPNDIYYSIKYFGDMKYGIITQCVIDQRLMNTPRGYFGNILLKINGKLDGRNTIIKSSDRPIVMKITANKPQTMIIGADVTHPAPADRMLSSVAACIGSYDMDFSKYSASITVQRKSKEEIIMQFDVMVTELLKQFGNYNKILPKSIVVFRDGVSEGQFDQVMDNEYNLLIEACDKLKTGYKPLITFIVVQKRHHTRFITADERDGDGRAGNVPPGTCVDTTVVHPTRHEYYIASHKGMLGTSRPAKYIVLLDDHKMSADAIEKLSYYLCYTYIRCIKSISIPTPVMYSHLAAKRSKYHIIAQNIKFEEKVKNETKDEREEREARIASLLNTKIKVNETLKHRLYYS